MKIDDKKIMKMWEEEENEKQLVVGDAMLDTINLHNLAVSFLKIISKG